MGLWVDWPLASVWHSGALSRPPSPVQPRGGGQEEHCIIIAYWIILCRVGQLLDYYTYCAVLARDRVFVFAGAFYTKHRYQLFLLLITSASCCFHGKSPRPTTTRHTWSQAWAPAFCRRYIINRSASAAILFLSREIYRNRRRCNCDSPEPCVKSPSLSVSERTSPRFSRPRYIIVALNSEH